jgi:hypothetical protein
MTSANTILKFDSNLKHVIVGPSKIKGAGQGLFAKKQIQRDQPVVVYHGTKITDREVYDIYINNPDEHKRLNSIIRGTPNGYVIQGIKCNVPVLQGVYVNDISCINIKVKKEEITKDVLQNYANTIKQCNLKIVDTVDFPIYYSVKTIKKGDELYVHYGIGYWLLHIGFAPEEINNLNKTYNFASFYTKMR